ncbi:MAG: hypothetical protein EBU88_09955 [Acidobacteria bacterium]|nr:hypothetical protein [Acidobacteriota bacterium]
MSNARTYRQRINNGPVVPRDLSAPRRAVEPQRLSPRASWLVPTGGLSIMMGIILAGGVVTAIFLLALNYQFDANKVGADDVNLTEELERLGNIQRASSVEQQQVMSIAEKKVLSEAGPGVVPVQAMGSPLQSSARAVDRFVVNNRRVPASNVKPANSPEGQSAAGRTAPTSSRATLESGGERTAEGSPTLPAGWRERVPGRDGL